MKKYISVFLTALMTLAPVLGYAPQTVAQSPLSKVGGKTYASAYANWRVTIQTAPTATGAGTILVTPGIPSNPDGSLVNGAFISPVGSIFTPIIVGLGSANQETVTPTAVSNCNSSGFGTATCAITATFANTHGPGDVVVSGDAGIQEAINALGASGGIVVVDGAAGATNAMLTAVTVSPKVAIEDTRTGNDVWWTPVSGSTILGTPTTLTAVTALPSATPVGAFGTGTYHMCIAYVDIMGQEGPCSADFSEAGLATGSFIFSSPAASAGAVGYTIYIGLTGGGVTNLNYKVPLVTQPTVIGSYPVANGVCTLTTAETVTPACSMVNTTYGTTAATATVTAITVNTSPVQPYSGVVSTTAITLGNAGGRTTAAYVPGVHMGTPGFPGTFVAFPTAGSAATTVPTVLATIDLPPGFMNYVGRTIEICGRAGITTGSTTTIVNIIFQWSAMGQDTAGLPVNIGRLAVTPATAFATTEMDNFCETFQTTVASASATGGSINTAGGFIATSGVAAAAAGQAAGGDALTGATGSLNLADDAKIHVVYTHTTGTFAPTLQNLTIRAINN